MMSEYVEKRKIVQAVPVGRPVIEHRHDSVIHEPRGMSGGAVAALVLSAIAATVLITMLILNSQQRDRDEQLARERAAAAQQTPAQQQQQPQQPPVIVMPQSPPAAVPVPTPAPSASAPSTTAPSSVEIEAAVSSKLLDDSELRSYPLDVKVSGGVATLSGQVPNEQLKMRAEKLARRVKGVASVINNIVVQP